VDKVTRQTGVNTGVTLVRVTRPTGVARGVTLVNKGEGKRPSLDPE
jgi:hypothetical protein